MWPCLPWHLYRRCTILVLGRACVDAMGSKTRDSSSKNLKFNKHSISILIHHILFWNVFFQYTQFVHWVENHIAAWFETLGGIRERERERERRYGAWHEEQRSRSPIFSSTCVGARDVQILEYCFRNLDQFSQFFSPLHIVLRVGMAEPEPWRFQGSESILNF